MVDAVDRLMIALFRPIIQPIMERLDTMADKLANLTEAVAIMTTSIGGVSTEMHTLADAVVAGHSSDDTDAVNSAAASIKNLATGLDTLVSNVQAQLNPPVPTPTPTPSAVPSAG